MSPALRGWIEKARHARLEDQILEPLWPGLVRAHVLHPEGAWQAAARAVLVYVGRRAASVRFSPGSSYAEIRRAVANLDSVLVSGLRAEDARGDVLLGVAAHEGAHLALSSRKPIRGSEAYRWIHNLIEDERIERRIARRVPRLAAPLATARNTLIEVPSDATGFYPALLSLVRNPERLSPQLWERRKWVLSRAMEILEPFPLTQRDVQEAARRLLTLAPAGERPPPFLEMLARLRDEQGERLRRRSKSRRRGRGSRKGGVEAGFPPVTWKDAPRAPDGYRDVHAEVKREAAIVRDRLRAALPPVAETRRRFGKLDRRRLWATPFDDRVFRSVERPGAPISLAIIIDLSGSMNGRRARLAQRIAVMLSEAALGLPDVRLYVYGHTADRALGGDGASTDLVRFATPARGPVLSLGDLPIGGNNRDAHALREIGADLRRRDGSAPAKRIAVLIADGIPDARGFSGREAFDATRDALTWLGGVWGTTLFVPVASHERLREMAPGPRLPFDPEAPVDSLVGMLSHALRLR